MKLIILAVWLEFGRNDERMMNKSIKIYCEIDKQIQNKYYRIL